MRKIILLGGLGVVVALFWLARPAAATDTTITETAGVWSVSQGSASYFDWIAELTEFDCPATDRPFVEIQIEIVSPWAERIAIDVIDLQYQWDADGTAVTGSLSAVDQGWSGYETPWVTFSTGGTTWRAAGEQGSDFLGAYAQVLDTTMDPVESLDPTHGVPYVYDDLRLVAGCEYVGAVQDPDDESRQIGVETGYFYPPPDGFFTPWLGLGLTNTACGEWEQPYIELQSRLTGATGQWFGAIDTTQLGYDFSSRYDGATTAGEMDLGAATWLTPSSTWETVTTTSGETFRIVGPANSGLLGSRGYVSEYDPSFIMELALELRTVTGCRPIEGSPLGARTPSSAAAGRWVATLKSARANILAIGSGWPSPRVGSVESGNR